MATKGLQQATEVLVHGPYPVTSQEEHRPVTDPSSYPDAEDHTGGGPTHESRPSTPRWVKLFGIIVLILILGFVIMKLAGVGGGHGPGRHTSADGIVGLVAPNEVSSAVEDSIHDTEAFGSTRTNILAGQTASIVVPPVRKATFEPEPMDAAMQRFSNIGLLDNDTQGLAAVLPA